MDKTDLSTSEVARRLNVGKSTVNLWCQRGLFPNARFEETFRGPVWIIPASDVENFKTPKMGRPPKAKAEGSKVGKKKGQK